MGYVDIEYNGILGSSLEVFMRERPAIPAAIENIELVSIPGRDGNLQIRKKTFAQTVIPVSFNYIGHETQWGKRWREAKKWLSQAGGRLKFSDDAAVFYNITHVEISENQKRGNRIGEFTATFYTRDGLSYLVEGENEYSSKEILLNPGIFSKPIYKIFGNGMCTLSVNENFIKANVSGDITIDTERMIAYRNDGKSQNTALLGNYEDIYLQEGENKVTVTDGFECTVIPRWRCL